jgi:cellulose synthase/poly-beta-1,6-N-acetylglucosamine synthase-like glycosyltransferase
MARGTVAVTGARLPFVDLRPARDAHGGALDPVSAEVAALLPPTAAQDAGILPFARTATAVYVATVWPMRAGAQELAERLGPRVRWFRASPRDLARAQERVYGTVAQEALARPRPRRLGDILAASGRVDGSRLSDALEAQRAAGGRLGQVLAASSAISFGDLAEALARQTGLALVDLLSGHWGARALGEGIDAALFDLMPEAFWRDHLAVPLGRRDHTLTVAVVDPYDDGITQQLAAATGMQVRRTVTGYRDVAAILAQRYRSQDVATSQADLFRRRPDDSARRLLSGGQVVAFAMLAAVVVGAVLRAPGLAAVILSAVAEAAYLAVILFRMWIMRQPTAEILEVRVSERELAALDSASLPIYTVLVPVFREAAVLPILARALAEIDYPKDRLDVKLLVEEDDEETRRAAIAARLPNYIEIVLVPKSQPRTKPKACNYGLVRARGEFTVIFDAEDIPEPDQLKKAICAFRAAGPDVACVQAKLSYFNRQQNLLTRWFTAEYAMWFDLLLPALHRARLPIPLGGTSNHFRTAVLRELGAWDPYNVAEDADLGVRLHKCGFRTLMMDSTTFEEANSEFVNWVRQRSRWVKGYMQTWLVHMRHPLKLYRELGPRGFVGFQMVVAGTPATFLLNPVYWALTTLWFGSSWLGIKALFPGWVYYVGMANLLVGNFVFAYLNMTACARRGDWDLVKYSLLAPVYWSMMSLAAWKAVMQLVGRASYWEKTDHGLTDVEVPLRLAAGGGEGAEARLEAVS